MVTGWSWTSQPDICPQPSSYNYIQGNTSIVYDAEEFSLAYMCSTGCYWDQNLNSFSSRSFRDSGLPFRCWIHLALVLGRDVIKHLDSLSLMWISSFPSIIY